MGGEFEGGGFSGGAIGERPLCDGVRSSEGGELSS